MSTTIRVSEETRARVAAISDATGEQMQTVVDRAIRAYEESLFWERFEQGYERLAGDADAWHAITDERAVEEKAVRDGIE
jgi:predicted transcriptional regulator